MADSSNGRSKSNVLVLGGVGFIGRHVVHYLVKHELADKILVVDKVMPQMGWLNSDHKESFSKVEFKHANLINAQSVSNVFHGRTFDFVINCAAESKLGQTDAGLGHVLIMEIATLQAMMYTSTHNMQGIYQLSCNCACEAARQSVRRYVEVSTAQITQSDKRPAREDDACSEAASSQARQKQEVEQELSNISGLNYVIVRPALVYGIGDRTSLTKFDGFDGNFVIFEGRIFSFGQDIAKVLERIASLLMFYTAPRLILGGIYRYIQETIQMLWTRDYRTSTVHVEDVAAAIWFLCNHGASGQVYNLADKTNATQGIISDIVSELFGTESNYLGTVASTFAKLNIDEILEDINEKHMGPWSEACTRDGIVNTPLTPFIDKELLLSKQLYVDGSKIESIGFRYQRPLLNKELLKEVLDDFISMGLYPSSFVNSISRSSGD